MATFSKKEAFNFGLAKFKQNAGFLVSILLITGLISFLPGFLFGLMSNPDSISQNDIPLFITIPSSILQMLISLGAIKIALKIIDNQKASYTDLFSQYRLLINYIIATLIYTIMVLLGTLLLIIPGIIIGITFQYYSYLIVDKGMGPIESLKQSAAITKGNKWNIFLFGLLSGLIILGGLVLLLIGAFVAIPVVTIAGAYVYRKLLTPSQIVAPETSLNPTPSTSTAA